MDWNDLRFFLAIVQAGSLAGAARRLGVNHSTVFRRLNALERRLGARLFDRLPEGYVATAAGERLRPRAERVQREVDSVGRELLGLDARLSGEVRVTTAPNLAIAFLPGYLKEFHDRYPDVRVELVISDQHQDLSRREADLALRATSAPPTHLVGRKALEIPWSVRGADAYLRRHGRPESMAELAQHRIIGGDDSMLRLPAFAWAARHLPPESTVARSNDLSVMAALASAGLGLALLPDDQVDPRLQRLFPLRPPVRTQLWLLTHPDLRKVPRIRALMRFIAERLREDPRLCAPGRRP